MTLEVKRTETQDMSVFKRDGRVWVDIEEEVVIEGKIYTRTGYTINGEASADIETTHFQNDNGEFRCGKCHHDAFRVASIGYTANATCSNCGFEAVVCDG
jgi:ribosomal protein S27AE